LGGQDVEVQTDQGMFYFESKSRATFVGEKWLQQVERHAKAQGKIAACQVHLTGRHHSNDIVMIRLKEWEDLHGLCNKKELATNVDA